MDADGSNQTRLTNNAAADGDSSFSPDGTKITFSSTRDGNYEIYVMNANGSNQTRLINNTTGDYEPSWGGQVDSDGDGQGNACDADDDNDGVLDATDAFPLDPNESVDTDSDGMGNNADSDDDNDGVVDGSDNCPLNFNPNQADFDRDGIGDTCDPQTGPPRDKNQCNNNNWMRFDTPRRFQNQGDCIQFVNTGK
jgi:dipeptidyl aminopeptidase/acylaminoacyl peptidase